MPGLSINIVSFDIPYPANYGGAIDIFYKIKTLHKMGVKIILHCFQYGRPIQKELEEYCEEVVYYKRKKGMKYLCSKLPYIVLTRNHKQLLRNLQKNNYPILFEGLHTCFYLGAPQLKKRVKIVRTHNIEHHYYEGLQKASRNIIKKIYFRLEWRKLQLFEPILKHASALAVISPEDQNYFSEIYKNTHLLPAFHLNSEITAQPGNGSYFLYHGNLAVEENSKAVDFLLDNVCNKIDDTFIIAGKNPPKEMGKKISAMQNVKLVTNPGFSEMNELLKDAQACVLPTFQDTGLKLKLLISLFSSRYLIANAAMIENTGLEKLCILAESAEDFIAQINALKNKTFTETQIEERKQVLQAFTNDYNGNKLINIIKDYA